MFLWKFSQTLGDRKLFAISFPSLKVGLEYGLEVESHGSETCALKIEVEVHVVLVVRAVFFQLCEGFYFWFASRFSPLLFLWEVGLSSLWLFFSQLTFLSFPNCTFFFGFYLRSHFARGLSNLAWVSNHGDTPIGSSLLFMSSDYKMAPFCLFGWTGWQDGARGSWLIWACEEIRLSRLKLSNWVLGLKLRKLIVSIPFRKKFEFLPDSKFVRHLWLPNGHLRIELEMLLEFKIFSEFPALICTIR